MQGDADYDGGRESKVASGVGIKVSKCVQGRLGRHLSSFEGILG